MTPSKRRWSVFYSGKKVVVVGGAGMVGSSLVKKLIDASADVVVLDNFSRGKTKFAGAKYVYGDAGLEGDCRDVIKGADLVFNLAATVAGVQFNQSNNAYMFESNIRLLTMPLRISAEYGVGRYLQTSSVCVYAPEHNHPAQEAYGLVGEPTHANAGYSWAKRMGEYEAMWYAEKGLHTVRVRPSNIVGIRDYFDSMAHVVPALIAKAYNNEVIEVNGSGEELREFIYVDDVAEGMMAALEYGAAGGVYNLGTDGYTCVPIKQIVDEIQRALRTVKPVSYKDMFDPGDGKRWSACGRAESELGWTSTMGIKRMIKAVCDWYVEERRAVSV